MAYSSSGEAKVNGWFSRRYRNSEVHAIASEAKHNKYEAKVNNSFDRQAIASRKTPQEKLNGLPKNGAKKERAKLMKKVAIAIAAQSQGTKKEKDKGKK